MEQSPSASATTSDYFDLQAEELLRFFAAHLKVIVACVIGALIAAAIFIYFTSPVFKAEALVQIESQTPEIGNILQAVQNVFDNTTNVGDEKEIVKSRIVIGPVVDELKLRNQVQPNYVPLIGEAIARRNYGLKSIFYNIPGLSGYAWGSEKIRVGTFEVSDNLLNQKLTLKLESDGAYRLETDAGKQLGTGKVGELFKLDHPEMHVELFVEFLVGRPGATFELKKLPKLAAILRFGNYLTVNEAARGSNLLRITVEDSDPRVAAEKANRVATHYLLQNVERRSEEARKTLEFLRGELPEIKDRLTRAEDALNNYRRAHGSVDMLHETGLLLERSDKVELKKLELNLRRKELLQQLTPQHPSVQAIDQQLAELGRQSDSVKVESHALPDVQRQILTLTRDVTVANDFYVAVIANSQQLEVAKAGKIGNVRIIDVAEVPLVKSFPIPLIIVPAAMFAGLLLGLVISFILNILDRTEQDPLVIERIVGVPSFAQVLYSNAEKEITKGAVKGQRRLLADIAGDDPSIEAIRGLRTTLHFGTVGASNNVIMLTGPSPSTGKSFVSSNLAALLAAAGKKVLLIDADMRRGTLHDYFGLQRAGGLSNYIGGDSIESVIKKIEGYSLDVITTGDLPPNPSELLLNDRFAELLLKVGQSYDQVLVDTGPVLAVADSTIVGQIAGASLLVVKAGGHTRRELEQTASRLVQAGVKLKGVVINQIQRSGARYGYSYGYYYYYGYDTDSKKRGKA